MASAIFRAFTRNMATSATDRVFKHVTVIGGGLMGSGIAQVRKLVLFLLLNPMKVEKSEMCWLKFVV